jgi:hypothetical protein
MSGVHYDNPMRVSYGLGLVDFGAADEATAIAVPPGKTRCRIESISVMATEVFAGSSSTARIELGTAADPNRYADTDMGTLADTDGHDIDPATDLFDIGHGGAGVIDITTENITQIEVGLIAAVGTPTGQGYTTITLAWW